jgi:hypothetical protein
MEGLQLFQCLLIVFTTSNEALMPFNSHFLLLDYPLKWFFKRQKLSDKGDNAEINVRS